MARFSAFLDACVLVPIAPCDTLLRLAERGAFRPLWSQRIFDEAISALVEIHPNIDENRFMSRFQSMNASFDDANVTGWESLEGGIHLNDIDDRHVVAAAIRGRADLIVTNNIKDFPASTLEPLGLEAVGLDDFLLDQLDLNPTATLELVRMQASAMQHPPTDVETLLVSLERGGVPRFASAIRSMITVQG